MIKPHLTAVYKLWDKNDSDESIYALYNINNETGEINRVEETWGVLQEVINSNGAIQTPIPIQDMVLLTEIIVGVVLVTSVVVLVAIIMIKRNKQKINNRISIA